MLGLLGLIVLHAKRLSDYVKENIQMSVILKDGANDAEVGQFQKTLDGSERVKSTEYISKEEAAKRLTADLGEDFVSFLGYNPLLASIDVRLKADYANPASMHQIEKEWLQRSFVKEVYYQKSLVDLVNENLRTIGLVVLGFSIILSLIAIALINNTIRLSLYSKRFLIKTMQLVGATKGFIRKPFILRGMVHGIYGSMIACVLLSGIIYFAQSQIPDLFALQDLQTFIYLFAGVFVSGILISWISTFFAVRKYLRMKLDELYI
jgi:cell division transport system permease protein